MNYKDEIRKLRFNFAEDSVLDYQTLLALAMGLFDSDEYEDSKEVLFQTLQVLVLVYGLEEKIHDDQYKFNEDDDLNNLDYWVFLLVLLFNDMETTNNFIISQNAASIVKKALSRLNNSLKEAVEAPVVEKSCQDSECTCGCQERSMTPEEYIAINSSEDLDKFNMEYLNKYIQEKKLMPYMCSCCGLSEWQNKPLILKLSHKNGNSNSIDNLIFLCPNCYSQIGK